MNSESVVTALAALAQASRLSVFRHLVECGQGGAQPGELSDGLDIPGATLSFHLKTLQHAGLVQAERRGRAIHYRADFATMQALLDYLGKNCCARDALACAPGKAGCTPAVPTGKTSSR